MRRPTSTAFFANALLIVAGLILAAAPARAQQQPASAATQAARQAFHGPDRSGKNGPFAKVGLDLAQLYYEHRASRRGAASTRAAGAASRPAPSLLPVQGGRVLVDAVAAEDAGALRARLEALGLEGGATAGPVVSGWLPIEALAETARLEALRFARPSLAKAQGQASAAQLQQVQQAGPVVSQGVQAMRADSAREVFGVDGTGITVGILSDSYDCLGGGGQDVGAGELPPDVLVTELDECTVPPDESDPLDEGRAMAQIVYDVAPGASIAFRTGFNGLADFATGIEDLADDGSSVIVDDIIYFGEPMFAEGQIAQAANRVAERGAAYFSSAGNSGNQSYESDGGFRDAGQGGPLSGGPLHDFDPGGGTDPYQDVTLPVGATVTISLQWPQPYPSAGHSAGAISDLDIVLIDQNGAEVASATNLGVGDDPVEVFQYENDGSTDADGDGTPDEQFRLGIELVEGTPPEDLLKYVYDTTFNDAGEGFVLEEYDAPHSTLYGHANASGAAAIGAAFYYNTPAFGLEAPAINPFSALGGTPIFLDGNGNRLAEPEVRQKPEVVGPDGVNNTFFGFDFPDTFVGGESIPGEDDDLPNFQGTSAAAPHVAGLAALMQDLNPDLDPPQLYQLLEATAVDMDSVRNGRFDPGPNGEFIGFDFKTGFGFVDALAALDAVPAELRVQAAPAVAEQGGLRADVRFVTAEPSLAERFVVEQCFGACGAGSGEYTTVQTIEATGDSVYTAMVELPTPGTYTVRVRQVNGGGEGDFLRTAQLSVELEGDFVLTEGYPSPFRNSAQLNLVVQEAQRVTAVLYDARGRRIRQVFEERATPATPVRIPIEAGALSSGVYFVRVEGGRGFLETRSLVLVR